MRVPLSPHVLVPAALALLAGCDAATSDAPGSAATAPDARSPPAGEPDPAPPGTPAPGGSLPGKPPSDPTSTDTPPLGPPSPDTTPPGAPPIDGAGRLLGIVGIDAARGAGGTTDLLYASFVTVGTDVPVARLLALLAPDGDRCRPRESGIEPIAPLVSVALGQTLIVDAPGGTWATMSRSDAQGFTAYAVPAGGSGTLPEGATLSLGGDPRPGAVRIALPDRPPALVATLDGGPDPDGQDELTADASPEPPVLDWSPAAPDTAPDAGNGTHVLLDLTIDGLGWRCELEDDGRATLDQRLLAPVGTTAGPEGGTPPDVRVQGIARIRQAIVSLEGDGGGDALLIRHRGTGTLSR